MDNYFTTLLAKETAVHDPPSVFLHATDRLGHVLALGLRSDRQRLVLANLIAQDIHNGAGVAVIDTTGQLARGALSHIPPHRVHDTYHWRPRTSGRVIGFNPFQGVRAETDKAIVSQGIVEAFMDIWALDYDRTPLLIDMVRNAARLVLDSQNGTLLTMYAVLSDDAYRARLVAQCNDAMTTRMWEDFARLPARDRRGMTQSTLTRLRAFLADPLLRLTLGQPNAALNLDFIVNRRKIILADLSRHELGAESARLLTCLLLTRLQTALARRWSGWPFYIYIPAAQEVHVGITGRLLSERLHHAGVVAGIDQIDGLSSENRASILAADTIVAARSNPLDMTHVAARMTVPRAVETIPALHEHQFALSGYPHFLTFADEVVTKRYRHGPAITQRSERGLGVPRRPLQRQIDLFIEQF